MLLVAGVFVLLGAAPCFGQDTAKSPSKEAIGKLFDAWNAALQTGKPEVVVKQYAEDAVLLPTVSNKVRKNHAQIKEYFEHFLELKPVGKINEANIRVYGNLAINSGVYTFTLTKGDKQNQVQARYTFVYRKIGDRWLIVEHHSSAMPEQPKAVNDKK